MAIDGKPEHRAALSAMLLACGESNHKPMGWIISEAGIEKYGPFIRGEKVNLAELILRGGELLGLPIILGTPADGEDIELYAVPYLPHQIDPDEDTSGDV